MTPLHIGERHQYFYSPSREAVAEHVRMGPVGARWRLMGWLWDGGVPTLADAKQRLAAYIDAFPTAAE